jgi:S-adenosylmethionine hydrolase
MAARLGPHTFVGPDNGLMTMLHAWSAQHDWPMAFYHLDRPEYWLKDISNVFHGRDVFSPVAAHLAAGVPLDRVGTPFHDPVLLPLPQVARTESGVSGEVIHIDHFGNISTNIPRAEIDGLGRVQVRIRGAEIDGLVRTFGDRPPGDLLALINSSGRLTVAVTNGNARERLGAQIGDRVDILRSMPE